MLNISTFTSNNKNNFYDIKEEFIDIVKTKLYSYTCFFDELNIEEEEAIPSLEYEFLIRYE